MSVDRRAARQTVVGHLCRGGILDTTARPSRPAASLSLRLGVPGIRLGPDGELTVDGRKCAGKHRRLSDLLSAAGDEGLYFADREALASSCTPAYDPVLYDAFRSFLPPRDKHGERGAPPGAPQPQDAHGRAYVFADLIVYQAGTLPGDEPYRSTGHWNVPGQLEIFQTLTGQVLMLVVGRVRDGRPFLYEQVCGPGDVMAVPFGVWHVSYALEGPAVVFNITTYGGDPDGEGDLVVADPGPEKYERARPIPVTARRRGADHELVGSAAALHSWGRPMGPPRTDWLASCLATDESLADVHLYASSSRLADIEMAGRDAYRRQWPLDDGLRDGHRAGGR